MSFHGWGQVDLSDSLFLHLKDWCWSWNSNTSATWCEELTHLKRPWCWERLKAGEGDNRWWDSWMALPTQWTWVWVDSRSWWWTGRPGMLQFMGSQRVRHDWVTEVNWTLSHRDLYISSQSTRRKTWFLLVFTTSLKGTFDRISKKGDFLALSKVIFPLNKT